MKLQTAVTIKRKPPPSNCRRIVHLITIDSQQIPLLILPPSEPASPPTLWNGFLLKSTIKDVMALGLCHYKSDGSPFTHRRLRPASALITVIFIWLLRGEGRAEPPPRHSISLARMLTNISQGEKTVLQETLKMSKHPQMINRRHVLTTQAGQYWRDKLKTAINWKETRTNVGLHLQ